MALTMIPIKPVPPPAGSFEEALDTAKLVGYPGAANLTNSDIEQEIRHMLWRES